MSSGVERYETKDASHIRSVRSFLAGSKKKRRFRGEFRHMNINLLTLDDVSAIQYKWCHNTVQGAISISRRECEKVVAERNHTRLASLVEMQLQRPSAMASRNAAFQV